MRRLGKEFDQKLLKHEFYAFIFIVCCVNTIFHKRNNSLLFIETSMLIESLDLCKLGKFLKSRLLKSNAY